MPNLRIKNKIINKPLIDIIKDIRDNCHNGKLSTIKTIGSDVRVTCVNPNHKGGYEKDASAGVYIGEDTDRLKYGTYHCFSCGIACSFIHFVALAFECSDERAEKWLIDNYADETDDSYIELPTLEINKPAKQFLNRNILKKFEDFHPYMLQRKLTKEIINKFEVKYDPITRCLVFPVYDEKKRLVLLTRRSVTDKTFIIDKNKEKPLYLLYNIIENNNTTALITEGQIDALTAQGYGYPCIATMGAISDTQIASLNKSGIRVLYTVFDNDEAGERFTRKLMRGLRKDILVFKVQLPNGYKDINDLDSKEQLENCIKKSQTAFNL